MVAWKDCIGAIKDHAYHCQTHSELLRYASSVRGVPTSDDALLGAWKRHRAEDWPSTPSEAVNKTITNRPGDDGLSREFEWGEDPETIPDSGIWNEQLPRPRLMLIPGDIHFPIHDRHALDAMLALCRDIQPDHLVLQGDTFDFHAASRFPSEPHRLANDPLLVDELRSGAGYIAEFDRLFDRVDYIEGNHEGKRRYELIQENPWLYQHASVSPESVLSLPARWSLHPWMSRLFIDGVCIEHGDRLKGVGGKYSAAAALRNTSYIDGLQTLIYGHTHRIDIARETRYDWQGNPVTRMAASVGHLSQLREHRFYSRQPNWHQGFGLLEWHSDGNHSVHLIEIKNARFSWGGKEYGKPWQ